MCFNIVIINVYKKTPKDNVIDKILSVIDYEAQLNHHGYSIHYVSYDREYVLRTLDYKKFREELEKLLNTPFRLIHIHLRLASAGSIDEQNVHMWKVGDYRVSHNGHVSSYGYRYHYRIGESIQLISLAGDSDTKKLVDDPEFQKHLIEHNLEKLGVLLMNKGFWGVMFASSPDNLIMISKEKSIKVYYYKGLLMFVNDDVRRFLEEVKEIGATIVSRIWHNTFENQIVLYDVNRLEPINVVYFSEIKKMMFEIKKFEVKKEEVKKEIKKHKREKRYRYLDDEEWEEELWLRGYYYDGEELW